MVLCSTGPWGVGMMVLSGSEDIKGHVAPEVWELHRLYGGLLASEVCRVEGASEVCRVERAGEERMDVSTESPFLFFSAGACVATRFLAVRPSAKRRLDPRGFVAWCA